jgi:hypothetical protein
MKEGRLARLRKALRVVSLERDEGRGGKLRTSHLVNLFALFVLILPSLRRGAVGAVANRSDRSLAQFQLLTISQLRQLLIFNSTSLSQPHIYTT